MTRRQILSLSGLALPGAAIQDFDNDGLPDLFVTTGMVYPEVEAADPAQPYKTVLFRNLGGGKFEELLDQPDPRCRNRIPAVGRRWEISTTTAPSTC